jgi:hypothetical protein
VRFRKDGFSTYLTGTPWSEDFMRQYAAALDGVKAQAGRRRMSGRVSARLTQGNGPAPRRDRLQREPNRIDHRPCHAQGGAAVRERRRSQAHGARGDGEAN